jgi:hypothetical protein
VSDPVGRIELGVCVTGLVTLPTGVTLGAFGVVLGAPVSPDPKGVTVSVLGIPIGPDPTGVTVGVLGAVFDMLVEPWPPNGGLTLRGVVVVLGGVLVLVPVFTLTGVENRSAMEPGSGGLGRAGGGMFRSVPKMEIARPRSAVVRCTIEVGFRPFSRVAIV